MGITALETPVTRRAQKRLGKQERDKLARLEAARRQEATDEQIAPKAQRDSRLQRDGNTFRAAAPLVRLYKSGQKRADAGDLPTIDANHLRAAERLHRAWDECQTISVGVSSYGESVRSTIQSGVMAQGVRDAVNHQIAAGIEVSKIKGSLGPLWNIVEAIALKGMDVKTWNDGQPKKMDAMAASGYLRAGLDIVVAAYATLDRQSARPLVKPLAMGR